MLSSIKIIQNTLSCSSWTQMSSLSFTFFPKLKILKLSKYAPLELKWLAYFSSKCFNIQVRSIQGPHTFQILKKDVQKLKWDSYTPPPPSLSKCIFAFECIQITSLQSPMNALAFKLYVSTPIHSNNIHFNSKILWSCQMNYGLPNH